MPKDCTCLKTHLNGVNQWQLSTTNKLKTLSKSKTEQQTAQTQAETEQAEVSVESLQEQLSKLEENLKLEKARTANAVYEAAKKRRAY